MRTNLTANRRNSVSRGLVALALAVFALSCLSAPPKKNLVLFPFGLGESVMETKGYKLQGELTSAVHTAFEKAGDYSISVFSRTHPSVKRALTEDMIKAAILMEPFTGKSGIDYKAVVLGKLLRGDIAAAGVIDDFSYDAAKKTAKIVVSLELYDVKASKSAGGVVLTATGSGETEALAAKDASQKMASVLVPQAIAIFNKPKPAG